MMWKNAKNFKEGASVRKSLNECQCHKYLHNLSAYIMKAHWHSGIEASYYRSDSHMSLELLS